MQFVTVPFWHLQVSNLGIGIHGGSIVAVSDLDLHLGRVRFLLAMRGEAASPAAFARVLASQGT